MFIRPVGSSKYSITRKNQAILHAKTSDKINILDKLKKKLTVVRNFEKKSLVFILS